MNTQANEVVGRKFDGLSGALRRFRAAKQTASLLMLIFSFTATWLWAADLQPGDLIVADPNADSGRGAIILVNPATGAQTILSAGGLFQEPVSLDIERSGTIVVADRSLRAIVRVDPATGSQTILSSGGFIDPFGIALDNDGNIYVTDTGWNISTGTNVPGRIIRVNPATGAQTVLASGGLLSDPWMLAFESTGTIVVSDSTSSVAPFTGQGGVIRIDPVTGIQTPVSVFHLGPAGTPGCPLGIAVEASGTILTSTFAYPAPPETPNYGCVPPGIFRVNPVTGTTTTVSANPTHSWQLPFGMDLETDGTIVVADEGVGLVRVNPVTGGQTPLSLYGLFVNPSDVVVVKFLAANSAPSITSLEAAPASVAEGSSTTLNGTFTDADAEDSHSASINWGDGTTTTVLVPAGTYTFSATHQYVEDNPSGTSSDPYTITAALTDSAVTDTETTVVTVDNAAPVITGISGPSGPQAVGSTVSVAANFTDAGAQDIHTCAINWGDGSTSAGSVMETNGSGFCGGSHTYATAGTFTVRVTITDDDGGSASSTINVTVNGSTAITSLVATGPINENGSTTLSGTFSDPDSTDTHTVTISWSDGSTSVLTLAAGVSSFSAPHQYLDDNPTGTATDVYSISVVVADNHGSSNSGSTTLTVKNVPPVISNVTGPSGALSLGAGATITADFTDAGTLDGHTCKFVWGDSTANTIVVAPGTGNGSCSATHVYATAGTYTVNVTVTDDDSGSVTSSNVSVTVASPNLNKIAFSSSRDGNLEIYSMNADGTGAVRLTNNPALDAFPQWSPDKSKILFSSTRAGSNPDFYVMNANGSNVTRLTTNGRVDGLGSWSPDGTKIAFTSYRDGNYEIYVMNANGSGQTRLTNNAAVDTTPAWSPDGTKIAFSSNRSGSSNYEIYIMNANGSGVIRLTNHSAVDIDPAWSPDGTKIAFGSNRDGEENFEIYVMNANGSGQLRLTNNAAIDIEPSWSPDGTKIAFTTNRVSWSNTEIYSMNSSDGANLVRLTNNSAFDTSGDW
jgi:Tol biopolymer transport system component/streptogramin lyase